MFSARRPAHVRFGTQPRSYTAVSYTHLDVYKRQVGHAFASQAGAQYDHRFFLFGRGVGVAAHRDEYKPQRKNGAAAEKDDF